MFSMCAVLAFFIIFLPTLKIEQRKQYFIQLQLLKFAIKIALKLQQ